MSRPKLRNKVRSVSKPLDGDKQKHNYSVQPGRGDTPKSEIFDIAKWSRLQREKNFFVA